MMFDAMAVHYYDHYKQPHPNRKDGIHLIALDKREVDCKTCLAHIRRDVSDEVKRLNDWVAGIKPIFKRGGEMPWGKKRTKV